MFTQRVKAAWACLGLAVQSEPAGPLQNGPTQQFPHLVQAGMGKRLDYDHTQCVIHSSALCFRLHAPSCR